MTRRHWNTPTHNPYRARKNKGALAFSRVKVICL